MTAFIKRAYTGQPYAHEGRKLIFVYVGGGGGGVHEEPTRTESLENY